MMKRECIEIDEMLEVLELPRDHPRRRHLEECPRCASRLVSLRSFLDISDLPAGADLADAQRRLSEAVAERIVRTGFPHEGLAADDRARPTRLAVVLDFFRRQPLRPILAVAVVAVVLLSVRLAMRTQEEYGEARTLRGETAAGETRPILDAPRLLPAGELSLSWRPAERAQAYRVVFYRADMSELARYEVGSAHELLLDAGTLEAFTDSPEPLYWGVAALRGRDEISRSPIRVFSVPDTP